MSQYTNKIKQTLDDYLLNADRASFEVLENLKRIIYKTTSDKHDLYYLCKIVPEEYVVKLIDYYNDSTLKIPSKKSYRETIILVIAFYLREIEGRDWKYIESQLNVDKNFSVNGVTLSKQVSSIKDTISKTTRDLFESIKVNDFLSLLEKLK